MLATAVQQLFIYKVVVGLTNNVRFLGSEETFKYTIAGQIDAIHVF